MKQSRKFEFRPLDSARTALRCLIAVISLVGAMAPGQSALAADEHRPKLDGEAAGADWKFAQPTAHLDQGQLVLDGRREMAQAFYLPLEWKDLTLRAKFLVEPADEGVLACGFMVRAVDGRTHYDLHLDRTQAILVRVDRGDSWIEIHRAGGLDKPAGTWHDAELTVTGGTFNVSLNGSPLYEARDATLARGRIGFYASQGLVRVKDIVVTGKGATPVAPFKIPPPHYQIVCADAGAGAYEAFPDVCRLADGRLMVVFYAGYAHVSLPDDTHPRGGKIAYCTSTDEGRTWSAASTLYDGPDDDRDPSIVELAGGRIVCNFFSLAKSAETGQPWVGRGTWVVESSDAGKSWSAARQVYADYYCSTPIRVLKSGRLVLPLYREEKGTSAGAIGQSDDGGRTWKKAIDIDNGGYKLDAETDVIELADGTLYAAQRPTMCLSVSKDQGSTWSISKPMGFEGHCPYFLRTSDNIILLAHRLPHTSLHYSLDECQGWSENVVIDSVIGAYPSMVNLKDGSVLVVYYEEGAGSNIRSRRFRAKKTGIEWIDE